MIKTTMIFVFIFIEASALSVFTQIVNKDERQGLLKAIIQSESTFFRQHISEYGGVDTVEKEMKVKKVTSKTGLNLYLVDQVMGFSACGSSGECQAWVVRKSSNGFELLLTTYGLSFATTSTNGYRDLSRSFGARVDFNQSTYYEGSFYKFDGRRYVQSCFKKKLKGKTKAISIPCD